MSERRGSWSTQPDQLFALRAFFCAGSALFCVYFALLLFCDVRRPVIDAQFKVTEKGVTVAAVRPGSPADIAGLRANDRVLSVNGRALGGRLDWLAVELSLPLGRPVPVGVDRAGMTLDLILRVEPAGVNFWGRPEGLLLAAVRAVQAITLGAGTLVWWRRFSDPVGRLGGWLLVTIGVFTIVPPYRLAQVWGDLPAPLVWSLWLPHLSAVALGAVIFSFFAAFPYRWIDAPKLWMLSWAPMVLTLAWYTRFALTALRHPEQHIDGRLLAWVYLPISTAYIVGACALLIRGYRRIDVELERRRARLILHSSVAALVVAPPLVIAYWTTSIELSPSLFVSPVYAAGTLWMLVFPLGFTYAILRHRLFDLPTIVREGIQYAFARRVILAVAPLAVLGLVLDTWVHRSDSFKDVLVRRGWVYAAVVVLALVVRLRRHVWLEALDRRFFREKYNAHQLLHRVAADIRRAGTFEGAAVDVVVRIEKALHPTVTAVLLRRVGGHLCEPIAHSPPDAAMTPVSADNPVLALARAVGTPLVSGLTDPRGLAAQLPAQARQWLQANGVELLVPIALQPEKMDAMLALGPRRSEEPYGTDDKDLLHAIADSLALVLVSHGGEEAEEPILMECAQCGRCEGSQVRRCPVDASLLVRSRTPRRINGRYVLERRVGRGGMGNVYEAVDTQLGRKVALKVMREELIDNSGAILRFKREARLIASLMHPNIVVVHDFGVTENGGAYLVMECLAGITLRERVTRGRSTPTEAIALLRGAANGLEEAHSRGIVHRDLKPENIFLAQQGPAVVVKILDFGIARLLSDMPSQAARSLTRAGELFGTPDYMSPEQSASEQPSPSWDLWALAVVAHEILSGRLPDERPEDALPSPLAGFFARALSLDVAERPPTATQFVDELEELLDKTAQSRS